MQTIVKAANDAGLLALMPHFLGMHPRNSVVLLGFRGNRTHGALRFDLPSVSGGRSALVYKRVARGLLGILSKLPGADGVVVAVVTDAAFGASAIPPHLEFVEELTRRIERSRFTVKGVLCRASDGWAPYFDRDVPTGGYSLADLVDADIAAQLPADLPNLVDPGAAPSRVPDAETAVKFTVMSDCMHMQSAIKGEVSESSALALLDDQSRFIDAVESALDLSEGVFLSIGGAMLSFVQYPLLRDLVLGQWAGDANTGHRLRAEVEFRAPQVGWADSELVEILSGRAPRPDPERIERAIQFVEKLVACADDLLRPAPLSMLGWLYWALGNGSMAAVYVAEATSIDPDDLRTNHLDRILRHGSLPEWAFRPNNDAGSGGGFFDEDDERYDEDDERYDEDDEDDEEGDYRDRRGSLR